MCREVDAAFCHLEGLIEIPVCSVCQVKILLEAHKFYLVLRLDHFLVVVDGLLLEEADAILEVL